MTDDAIYFKTAAGDEAVRERTRLVKRNLRMVLILVDGFADVTELKRKVGDDATVEGALAELERVGLIESIDDRMARKVVAAQESGMAGTVDAPAAAEVAEAEADLSQSVPEAPAAAEPPVLTDVVSVEPHAVEAPLTDAVTVFDEETAAKVWMIPGFSASGGEQPPPPPSSPPRRSPRELALGWWEAVRSRFAHAREEALYEKAYGQSEAEAVKVRPIQRGPRASRSLLVRGAQGLVGTLVLGVLGVLLFPYDHYRPDFERRLSLVLDGPVKVGRVQVSYSPYPSITLERVVLGDGYASADAIRLLPDPLSLVGDHRYREVRVEGLRLTEPALARVSHWLATGGLGRASIQHLELVTPAIQLGTRTLRGPDGVAQLDAQGRLEKVLLGKADEGLQAEVVPGPDGLSIFVSVSGWKAPFEPALVFDRLDIRGDLAPGRFAIRSLDGQLYDGAVSGAGVLAWQPAASLTLDLQFERLAAGSLLPLFGAEPGLEGSANGKLRVGAAAATLGGLDRALRIEGGFSVSQGGLKRIDLVRAMRAAGQGLPVRGGTTRFEEFSGALAMDEKAVRLTRLRLSSGLMQAYGQVAVSRQTMAISGGGSAEMRGTANAVRANVAVSGNAADPELKAGP